jgi:hypothetical protein
VLYDSQTRYEDDCHAKGYNLYACVKCGHFNFQDWEIGDPEHDINEDRPFVWSLSR